jgi:hypothetical protein
LLPGRNPSVEAVEADLQLSRMAAGSYSKSCKSASTASTEPTLPLRLRFFILKLILLLNIEMTDHIQSFTKVYETCAWGDNKSSEYKGSSGEGSSIEYNLGTYIPFIRAFFKTRNIESVVDVGCGDWRCGELIYRNLGINYTGVDAYETLIERHKKQWEKHTWLHLNGYADRAQLPEADVLLLKDVIQHWTTAEIYTFLDDVIASKKYKYIMLINCCFQKTDDEDIGAHCIDTYRFRPLSSTKLPLKKYNPQVLTRYHTKEVCLIETS